MNTTITLPSIDQYFSENFPYSLSNASFKDLINIHKSEQYSNAKIFHKIKSKVVWLSVLEGESVPLAFSIWDQWIYNTVQLYYEINSISKQTYQLISLINRFWKMYNMHSPGKDIRLRDPDLKVFRLQDDLLCFSKFVSWLQEWKTFSCSGRPGKISSPTITSLIPRRKFLTFLLSHEKSYAIYE